MNALEIVSSRDSVLSTVIQTLANKASLVVADGSIAISGVRSM